MRNSMKNSMKNSITLTHSPKTGQALKAMMLAGIMIGSTACMTFDGGSTAEGIGYRQARFAEMSAMNEFRACKADGLALDEQARLDASGAKYLASAKILEQCEASVGSVDQTIGSDERMRVYALSIQNYVKGGDIAKAADSLNQFQSAFPNKDLYYADGSSFIETMLVITHQKEDANFSVASTLNVPRALKIEKNRIAHWEIH